jgi:hypothetical protein
MRDEVQKLRTFLADLITKEQQARNERTIRREYQRAGLEPPPGGHLVSAIVGAVRKSGKNSNSRNHARPLKRNRQTASRQSFAVTVASVEAVMARPPV